jgi:hypothetical protein
MNSKQSVVLKFIWLTLALLVFGCSTMRGYPDSAKDELPSNDNSIFLFSDAEYAAITDKDSRNKSTQKKLRDIDLSYSEFESGIYKENVSLGLATDITLLALTGGTVLTGSTGEKELFGALGAFLLGSKSSYDKRALLENTMSVLVQKMRADKAVVRNDILRGQALEIQEYSADNVATDIARYFYAGTFPSALSGLAKVAVEEEEQANEEAREIQREQFMSDGARICLLDYWKPGGVKNNTNGQDIITWLKASKYKNTPFGLFMNASSSAKARIAAVSDLIETGKITDCQL